MHEIHANVYCDHITRFWLHNMQPNVNVAVANLVKGV